MALRSIAVQEISHGLFQNISALFQIKDKTQSGRHQKLPSQQSGARIDISDDIRNGTQG